MITYIHSTMNRRQGVLKCRTFNYEGDQFLNGFRINMNPSDGVEPESQSGVVNFILPFNYSELAPGDYDILVRAIDILGQPQSKSVTVTIKQPQEACDHGSFCTNGAICTNEGTCPVQLSNMDKCPVALHQGNHRCHPCSNSGDIHTEFLIVWIFLSHQVTGHPKTACIECPRKLKRQKW